MGIECIVVPGRGAGSGEGKLLEWRRRRRTEEVREMQDVGRERGI